MRRLLFILFLPLLLPLNAAAQNEAFPSIDNQAFAQFVQMTPGVQLLDARTSQEYQEGHIKNSILIDWKRDDFTEIALKVLQKDVPVAIYCRSGRRSREAAQKLLDEGFQTVVNLDKGINSWKEEGMMVEP